MNKFAYTKFSRGALVTDPAVIFPDGHKKVQKPHSLRHTVLKGLLFLSQWKNKIAAFLFIIGMMHVFYFKGYNLYFFWYHPFYNTYSLSVTFYIVSRFVFGYFYKPPPDAGYFPSVTVTIACKNEEDSILKTIDCIYRSDYPMDKLQVISVDDGSTDRTWEEMELAQKKYPSLKLIHFSKNLGKRCGMEAGIRAANGEILVFVDSDSFVRPDAIMKLCQGFVDSSVGAVCGHAFIKNARKNILTKMQDVRYFVAFRVVKAAESLFSAVTCCSGCLSAYRRDAVMPILDAWINQKFLGTAATFGDDRSLTNFVLRQHRVIYHSEAICTTIVPDTMSKFLRQQLRWKKSWIRESFLACQFIWRRHPITAFFFYLGVVFPILSPIIVLTTVFAPLVGIGSASLVYIYGSVLMAAVSSLPYLFFMRRHSRFWIHGAVYSVFYMLVLVWQTYYAMFTVRKNHWGTR